MDLQTLQRIDDCTWTIPRSGANRGAACCCTATPTCSRRWTTRCSSRSPTSRSCRGWSGYAMTMPDAHWGYGFPIGGVAAFDPERGGIISAGGVGFDISCGIRCLRTSLAGGGSRAGGAQALRRAVPGHSGGRGRGGQPEALAARAGRGPHRRRAVGGARGLRRSTRTSNTSRRTAAWRAPGPATFPRSPSRASAARWARSARATTTSRCRSSSASTTRRPRRPSGFRAGQVVVSIHCGSRGLGPPDRHRVPGEPRQGAPDGWASTLPDRELACAPIRSPEGEEYLGAMNAAINCALANRQILAHLTRRVFAPLLPGRRRSRRCSTSRTTPASPSGTRSDGKRRLLYVHRKGATRALRSGPPRRPRALSRGGPAGDHRRQHGHGLVRPRRHDRRARRGHSARRATAPGAR